MSEDQSNKLAAEKSNPARSFYQRQLPESCTSNRGKALFFVQPWPTAISTLSFRWPLNFVTQHEPSLYGFRKDPWRWFEQDMLDSCRPLESIRKNRITLAEFKTVWLIVTGSP
ncbi:hypothetical protein PGTUg99_026055 [Puccinia graminis f. sp. tritici]|uniref:Peptidase C83 domain-containing protein n=1 Tax=Puccinia graminis f. sp. tritici TaxID=56615 RepID=A0A5B0NIJ0_PUCGR|nr:hypothetical protein PGTUg99_026055 [Puccinia graminis f. sp. tritici]